MVFKNDLTLYLNSRKITTYLTHDLNYNKSRKSILSIEMLHKSFVVEAEVSPVWQQCKLFWSHLEDL